MGDDIPAGRDEIRGGAGARALDLSISGLREDEPDGERQCGWDMIFHGTMDTYWFGCLV